MSTNTKNPDSCVGCQLYGQCGTVCETPDDGKSAWEKLLLPCVLLAAVILLVGASYIINLVF